MSIAVLEAKRNKLYTDAQAILLGESVTSEARTSAKAMIADALATEGDIENLRSIETAQASQVAFQRSARPTVVGATGAEVSVEETRKNFSAAFRQYARHGMHTVSAEQRALLTTSDATGGALIPQAFEGVLHDAKKYIGSTAQKVAQKVTDNKGVPMKISFGNDTSNGLVLLGTEGTSGPVETDPTFSSSILNVDTVTGGLVKVSFQELEDSSFDLTTFLREKFQVRYLRGLETAVTLGKDTAATALPSQATGGLIGVATVGDTTATIAAGLGWSDFTTAFGSLDPAYVDGASWVMSSQTRAYLIGLKDGFGRPFFTPDPSGMNPFNKILGFDIVLNQAMPLYSTANAKSVLFGDLSQSYMLRTDGSPSILALHERYADTLEVGFYLYTRVGGIGLNAGISPIVYIQTAAS
jgi:HK97 family phage major capsid protein